MRWWRSLSVLAGVVQVWLKQPLVELGDITARHDAVEAFATDPELRERLRDQCFRGVPPPVPSCNPPRHHLDRHPKILLRRPASRH